jgi:uncharacterized protein (TIGR02391 family)
MDSSWKLFERFARSAFRFSDTSKESQPLHPFEIRDIHPFLPGTVRKLFDNGHYSQATFEAFKFVDHEVARISKHNLSGFKLMMAVLAEDNPVIQITPCKNTTEKDEQKGFQFLFAGSMLAIRNPRGHQYSVVDTPDECLDHLALASILIRRLESAQYVITDASKITV